MIANELANKGKKPTVALIKGQLSTALPLFEIINALKLWQHEPTFIQTKSVACIELESDILPEDENADLIRKIIEEKLQPVKQEIAELKSLLLSIEKKVS